MKSEAKKLENGKIEIKVALEGEAVKNKFEEVFERIGKEAKIKGFRPGHVPKDILEKQFTPQAHQQVIREMVPELYGKALENEKIEAIDMPEISDVNLDRNSISFKAVVETSPEIKLGDYKKIHIKFHRVKVDADEVKRNLDSLKEMRKAEALDDAFAKSLTYPDLAELQKAVERQIINQKDNLERQQIEGQAIEQLSKGLDFKLPSSMVEKQLQHLLREAKIDLALKGMQKEQLAQKEETLTKELDPEARRQVRTYLILSAVAKKENIPIDDAMPKKVMEMIYREAQWTEITD